MTRLPPMKVPPLTGDDDSTKPRNQEPPRAPQNREPRHREPENQESEHQEAAGTPHPKKKSGKRLPALRKILSKALDAPLVTAPAPEPAPLLFIPTDNELTLNGLPIQTYKIGSHYYNMQREPHETWNEAARTTVDGRHISYTLHVVQQPDKARACGAGNKSSNDRRPVDPPPVVELKVYSNNEDITSTYDATFMLYASLEPGRPIANGKIHTPTNPAVLAGVTVASAAYLEKPQRAAYFIFPDLSVRHEGWYRLRFSLFEGVKHEADADADKPFDRNLQSDSLNAPVRHEGVFNRMDVVSVPFQVYSAKKFPGLDQSTELSVLVADQGCRVRIRRDVRQRKRNAKPGNEGGDTPNSYQGTPQANYGNVDHSRTASRNSIGSQYERRESVDSFHHVRPALPPRQMSASSLPLTSPVLPSPVSSMPPPSAYGPPPMHRPLIESLPRPMPPPPVSNHGQAPPPPHMPAPSSMGSTMLRDPEHQLTLPPLRTIYSSGPKQLPDTPRYNLPPANASKRPYGPNDHGQRTALKSGARPGALPEYSTWYAPNGEDIIEPDTSDNHPTFKEPDPAIEGDLIYSRADGSTSVQPFPPKSYTTSPTIRG